MTNMSELDDLRRSILGLHEKIDRVLAMLETQQIRNTRPARAPKQKPSPLTNEEIKELQSEFGRVYETWVAGAELEAQSALERLDVEQLRRLADANNLNVTAKMPREKVLYLIGARFREKKQLHKTAAPRDQRHE